MNFYPIYGHIGFKLFIACCTFQAFQHSQAHLNEMQRLNGTLTNVKHALENRTKDY